MPYRERQPDFLDSVHRPKRAETDLGRYRRDDQFAHRQCSLKCSRRSCSANLTPSGFVSVIINICSFIDADGKEADYGYQSFCRDNDDPFGILRDMVGILINLTISSTRESKGLWEKGQKNETSGVQRRLTHRRKVILFLLIIAMGCENKAPPSKTSLKQMRPPSQPMFIIRKTSVPKRPDSESLSRRSVGNPCDLTKEDLFRSYLTPCLFKGGASQRGNVNSTFSPQNPYRNSCLSLATAIRLP